MATAMWRQLLDEATAQEAAFIRAFLQAVEQARGAADRRAIERALSAYRIDEAVRIVQESWTAAAAQWSPLLSSQVVEALARGGTIASGGFRLEARLVFDRTNPEAVRWARNRSASLVTQVSEDLRQGLRDTITRAFAEQVDVPGTARAIRQVLGLRPDQVRALNTYRQELQTLAASAEPTVRATRMRRLSSRGLTRERIDAWVERYRQRLLQQRATLVARTELLTSSNQGQLELWRQAIEAGRLDAGALKRWLITPDDRLCADICVPMEGQVQLVNEPFVLPDGGTVLMPPAHPNCRCVGSLQSIPARARGAA